MAETKPKIDGSAISHRGMMLLGYQRTKQISRRSKLAWEAGNPRPLDAEARARRDEIFDGALEEIRTEYLPLRDALRKRKVPPGSVIDIGCGQAINCALLFRDFGGTYTLVDIEETPGQYHLWNAEGSGYASLDDAAAFLLANGLAKKDLRVINPRKTPDAMSKLKADLVVSSFSCGFHYPVGEYVDLMCDTIAGGGAVMLDLRLRYLNNPDPALTRLLSAGRQEVLLVLPKSHRVLLTA